MVHADRVDSCSGLGEEAAQRQDPAALANACIALWAQTPELTPMRVRVRKSTVDRW